MQREASVQDKNGGESSFICDVKKAYQTCKISQIAAFVCAVTLQYSHWKSATRDFSNVFIALELSSHSKNQLRHSSPGKQKIYFSLQI